MNFDFPFVLHTLNLAVVLLLSESRAIINDIDVILHGFMLHIIYTAVFEYNPLTWIVKKKQREKRILLIYFPRKHISIIAFYPLT
jgi:uncharacterized membrane protein